jgi:prepilin-type N-terminal cleavage/methylation domain-containing protein
MNKKNAGFTLIEVLTVIAIIGIAAAFSVPALLNVLPNWRAKAAATDLFSDLQLAKTAAIRRGGDCVVTFSGNPEGGVPCQYQISLINRTVSLNDVGSDVVFRGPVAGALYPRYDGDTGSEVTWTLTFNSRGMVSGDAINVNFSSMKFADTDPKRTYYRAGATTAGVIHMQRYEGSVWR